jgi:hypothetical protein
MATQEVDHAELVLLVEKTFLHANMKIFCAMRSGSILVLVIVRLHSLASRACG